MAISFGNTDAALVVQDNTGVFNIPDGKEMSIEFWIKTNFNHESAYVSIIEKGTESEYWAIAYDKNNSSGSGCCSIFLLS